MLLPKRTRQFRLKARPATAPNGIGQNPLKKIILMVGVAIIVFLAFMVYSLKTSVRNSEQLTTIKELYFPILERVDASIVRIDKIEERFMQAVMTGEQDELGNAELQFQQADGLFTEMARLYTARDAEIKTLQLKLATYFALGQQTSLALLHPKAEDQAGLSQRMNQSLGDLRESVQHFRAESYQQFVHTLEASQEAATLTLYIGIAVGVMNLFFMAVLVYFIRNNIRMMAVIAEQNATLENRVAERTAELSRKTNDINAMLDNMNLGVCTVVPGGQIHPEYSAHLRVIFEQAELAHHNVLQALFSDARIGVDIRDQLSVALEAILGEDRMMFDCNSHLLLREMQLERMGSTQKILQLDWNPITNTDDQVEKLLLIVQDVTELRALELATAQQKEELDIIARLIKVASGKFSDFVSSALKFVTENRQLIDATQVRDPDVIAALFRNMHTLKGNARTYELTLITDAAHTAEQEYDHLRKEADALWNPTKMHQELDAVLVAINRYVDVSEDKLGRKGHTPDLAVGDGYPMPKSELASLKQQARHLLANENGAEWQELAHRINRLGLISLEKLIQGAMDTIVSLATELQKPPPRVECEPTDLAFEPPLAEALRSALMHIIRNALDHGVESPLERQSRGKSAEGLLRFHCSQQAGKTVLHIGDDGRGLALHKLYEKGLQQGIFQSENAPEPATVAEMIFQSGVSTAEHLTLVSGRGVGMDAARAFLKERGADLGISLLKIPSELDYTPFEFIISLPEPA